MPRYGPKAHDKVAEVLHEFKQGRLRSGSAGQKVTSRRQAIAIGLSEARREGDPVPAEPASKAAGRKAAAKKAAAKKAAAKKAPAKAASKQAAAKKAISKKATAKKPARTPAAHSGTRRP